MICQKVLVSLASLTLAILASLHGDLKLALNQKNPLLGSCFSDAWGDMAAQSEKSQCIIPKPDSKLRRPGLSAELQSRLQKQTIG